MTKIKVKCKVDLKQIADDVLEKELKSRDYIVFEDWKDCLDEANEDDLKEELEDRGFEVTENILNDNKPETKENVPYFELKSETLAKLKAVLGLKEYHDKQRVFQEIDELYQ